MPLPGNRDEHWRYSSVKKLALETLIVAAEPSDAEKQEALALSKGLAENAAKLVFLNDRLISNTGCQPVETTGVPAGSPHDTQAGSLCYSGVVCLSFDEALRTQGDVLEQYLMKRKAELGSEKFAALHLAHVRAGAVILVPKNVVITQPIEVFHWVTGENNVVFPHTLIVTG